MGVRVDGADADLIVVTVTIRMKEINASTEEQLTASFGAKGRAYIRAAKSGVSWRGPSRIVGNGSD